MALRSRLSILALGLTAAVAAPLVASDAEASVSIAVSFDALVKDSDAVAVATPTEQTSVWEDGRIYTYTKVTIDRPVAGGAGGSENWVRTMGGVVGKIGQRVDGEPTFTVGKSSLVFLKQFKTGTWQITARAQGQYPVVMDLEKKAPKVVPSAAVGMLLEPKGKALEFAQIATLEGQGKTVSPQATSTTLKDVKIRFAREVMSDRPLDDVARDVVTTWSRFHPTKSAK